MAGSSAAEGPRAPSLCLESILSAPWRSPLLLIYKIVISVPSSDNRITHTKREPNWGSVCVSPSPLLPPNPTNCPWRGSESGRGPKDQKELLVLGPEVRQ